MREDGLGLRLLEALAAKAAQGVEVCFLFDSFGSAAMKPSIIRKWRSRGLKMATFCAVSGWRERWRLNLRNHRKNVIVDGRVGFVGGHNVGDGWRAGRRTNTNCARCFPSGNLDGGAAAVDREPLFRA